MSDRNQARLAGVVIVGATFLLPLLGAWGAGRDLRPIFQFPPSLTIPTDYPRFSWVAFVLIVAPFASLAGAWRWQRIRPAGFVTVSAGERNRGSPPTRDFVFSARTRGHNRLGPWEHTSRHSAATTLPESDPSRSQRFPLWGWIAAGWVVAWWILAWTRFAWFAPLQPYTFFPLWVGFIAVVNAATLAHAGTCALTRRPAQILSLFGVSAAFWWMFEWLNRFTDNWHYLGVADFGAVTYAAHATLCFSTVLPAVSAVKERLETSAKWRQRCAAGPRWGWLARPSAGWVLLLAGSFGLVGAGAEPTRFYPALWSAPLAGLVGASILARFRDLPMQIAVGDWGATASWAAAALICGFFWELWNFSSAAHWIYTVPDADRWHVFAMPILGYLGYLPFGLECYFAVRWIFGTDFVSPFSSVSST